MCVYTRNPEIKINKSTEPPGTRICYKKSVLERSMLFTNSSRSGKVQNVLFDRV